MAHGTFATVINCMDGRTQLPMIEWMKEQYVVDHVDMITEPGPNGLIGKDAEKTESIRQRVDISVNGHGSKAIAMVGHYDCAGNPGPKEQHVREVGESIEVIKTWGLPADIIGVWIGDDWKVQKLE